MDPIEFIENVDDENRFFSFHCIDLFLLFHFPPFLVWRFFLFASTGHLFNMHVADERQQNENDLLRGKLSVHCTQYYSLHGFHTMAVLFYLKCQCVCW